jgi:hypothetical protein
MLRYPMWATISVLALGACSNAAPTSGAESEAAEAATASQDASPAAPEGSTPMATPNITPTAAAAVAPPARTTCRNIMGRLTDTAPEGRNVRAGPSVSARLLGVIGAPLRADQTPNGDFDLPAEFEIVGSANGWLLIRNAGYDESLAGGPVPAVYRGEGWISGRLVQVGLQTRAAFSEPSHASPVLIGGATDAHLDGLAQRGIAACQDQWVLVDWERPVSRVGERIPSWVPAAIYRQEPFTLRAWAAGVCNIMETSCDGVDGTTAESAFRD